MSNNGFSAAALAAMEGAHRVVDINDNNLNSALQNDSVAMAKIVVPFKDNEVKAKLRQLHEPIIIFDESAPNRRQRLRVAMFNRGMTGLEKSDGGAGGGDGADGGNERNKMTIRTQEAVSRGGEKLKAWREEYATATMGKAEGRITQLKQLYVEHQSGQLAASKRTELERLRHLANTKSSSSAGVADPFATAAAVSTSVATLATDRSKVIVGKEDGDVQLWDVDEMKQLGCENTGSGCRVTSVASSIAQSLVATTTRTKETILWSLASAEEATDSGNKMTFNRLTTFKDNLAPVNRCAFDPVRGNLLATTSQDMTIRFYDVSRSGDDCPALLYTQDGHDPRSGNIWALAFHPDGSLLCTTDHSGMALTWDLRSGRCIWRLPQSHDGKCTAVAWAPDGVRYATGGEDGIVMQWDSRCMSSNTGSTSSTTTPQGLLVALAAHNDVVSDIKFAPSASFITCGLDKLVKVWDIDSGALIKSLPGHQGAPRGLDIVQPKVSASKRYPGGWALATVSREPSWKLWEADEDFVSIIEAPAAAPVAAPVSQAQPAVQAQPANGDDSDSSDDEMAALRKKKKAAPPPPPKPTAPVNDDDSSSDDEMAALRQKK